MSSKIKIYFAIKSDKVIDFTEIEKLGLVASKKHQIGDIGSNNQKYSFSSWILSTKDYHTWDYDLVVMELMQKLIPVQQKLKVIISKNNYDCVLQSVVSIDMNEEEPTPSIGIDRQVIDFLNSVGAIYDVDIYRHNSNLKDLQHSL